LYVYGKSIVFIRGCTAIGCKDIIYIDYFFLFSDDESKTQATEHEISPNTIVSMDLNNPFNYVTRPNVVVQQLTLLLRNLEVPGSNLGPETDYPI
jgi:hypothetical protein